MQLIYCALCCWDFSLMLDPGGEWREGKGGRESFLCFSQSTERLDPALVSPLIPLKLNFNGLLLVAALPCVCVEYLCMYPASLTFPSSGWAPPPHCRGDSTGWWGWHSRRLSSPPRAAASAQGRAASSDQTTKLRNSKDKRTDLRTKHTDKETNFKKKKRVCETEAFKQILPPQHKESGWLVWEHCLVVCSLPSARQVSSQVPTPYPQFPDEDREGFNTCTWPNT